MPGAGNLHGSLIETAASYLQLGWSVVPLWGDSRPNQPKVAAVPWEPYQRRRAGAPDLQRWFTGSAYAGLGIVTGSVSQLVVLDFDTPELFPTFEQTLPELAETRTVLTRRGRHLYFRVPPHVRVASRKLAGVDLLSDGHYVVAPPTVINGHEYRVERGGLPKTLDQADIKRIHAFLNRYSEKRVITPQEAPGSTFKAPIAIQCEKPQEAAFTCQDEPSIWTPSHREPTEDAFLTADGLVHLYRSLARQSKRNVALFKASCLARDHGWQYKAVVAVLAGVHASERPIGQHATEKPKARRREAVRTIRSAFSKPPRPARPRDTGGLFNSIREKLLQIGQTCVVRVLEGLRLAGVKAGQLISERRVLELLRGLVGRRSVRQALAAKTPTGAPIFEAVRSPRYPPRCAAATSIRIDRQINAYVNRTKRDKNRGRPETRYRIPTPEALCQRLGAMPSASDPITVNDLKTAKGTRQALQRGLIRRRPGTYLRKWLGDRLGVSERTISRYNDQIVDVHVVPTFTQTPLHWGNLNAIPAPQVAPAGTCLEDSTGKRWPALKGVAQKLLGQGRGVRLLVRSLNYYWYGQGDPPVTAELQIQRAIDVQPPKEAAVPVMTLAQQVARLVKTVRPVAFTVPNAPPRPNGAGTTNPRPVSKPVMPVTPERTRKHRPRYWRPFKQTDLETLAERVYADVNSHIDDANTRVSLATVRKWIDVYGPQAVSVSLETLRARRDVRSPAGFLATVLRSSGR